MQEAQKIIAIIEQQFKPTPVTDPDTNDKMTGRLVVELDWGTDRAKFAFDGEHCAAVSAPTDLKIHVGNLSILEQLLNGQTHPMEAFYAKTLKAEGYIVPTFRFLMSVIKSQPN
ncbi:MAG: hypothetical protein AAF541_15955 [Pseudomonadota bacterium]